MAAQCVHPCSRIVATYPCQHLPFAVQGPGCNDCTSMERAINILTSLPFMAVGLHTRRQVAKSPLLEHDRGSSAGVHLSYLVACMTVGQRHLHPGPA